MPRPMQFIPPACRCSSVRRLARRSVFSRLDYGFPGRNQRFLPALATKPPPEVLLNASRHTSDVGHWFGMTEKGYPLVGADIIRPIGLPPGRRRCEASRRVFRRRRRCETKRSDLGWRFSFFSHSFFCKKKKEWEKEKTYPFRWFSIHPRGRGRCAGPILFLFLERKSIERKNRLRSLKGFLAPSPRITARIRSLWRSVGGCPTP